MKAAKATLRVSRAAPKPRPSAAAVVPANITVGCRVAVRVVEGEDPLPGVVLFIGETKFAEGPWLGIELDEPKGKNNGKVQDVVYFTCRPNHGIFVRAAKVLKLEEQPKSNAQEASPANADASQFAVGARVLVRTLENVQGTVRFNGSTQFAEGEWLGVELDQPQGKNDGTVRGVAYFSCPPLHGLFARPGNLVLDQSAASSTSPTTTPQSAAETLQEAQDPGFPGESTREASKAEPLAVKVPQDVLQISKELKEQFLSEVQQFEEWRTAPRCLGNRELTGWGAFLKEQRALPREGEVSLRQVAEAAAERWRELGAEEKERYRLQAETAVRRGATYRPKAMAGGAFASAVYGLETKLKAKTRDAPEEAQDLDKKERKKAEKKRSPEATASLAQLREERWASQGPDSTVPVFLWELEEHKVDKALSGDLHLPSPETDKVGHLDPDITRFTRMKTMKGLEVLLLSFNEATQACKVVYPSRDENRVGWVSLLELRFLAPVEDFEPLAVELEDEDFFPPEVGDLHRVHRAGGKDQYAVKEVWEDEDTGFYHWTYGDKLIDSQAHATCCSAHGKFLIPFRRLPKVDIEQMKRDEVAKRETRKSRKTPESWSDLPLLWRMMQAGKAHLEVANPGAAISELAALTGKKRGGKRNAVAALPNAVRKRRQQVEVKCTAEAFLCQPGSRFGLLSQNALGLSCIMRCVTAVELLTDGSGKVKVKTDNCEEESTIDPTPSQAMKFPQLEYEGGTELTVLLADGRLVNGTVTRNERWNRYAITAQGEEELVDLNEANHVKGHMANFDVELYREYCTAQRDRYRFLEDSITCQKMDVETQVIYIDTAVENAKVSTPDIKSLATMLLDSDGERYLGQQLAYRCLMVAGPGTGKTWSSCQLMYHLSKACTANADTRGLVKMPVLLFVQKMAGMMRTEGVTDKAYAEMSLAAKDDVLNKPWLEEAFKTEYNAKYGEALMRALRLRAAVVILDGIDEASDVKGVMQDYILRRLVPMQICLVVTSRPEGVSAALKSLRTRPRAWRLEDLEA
ncbi:unnamed protein product [Effrenium voratum]|nr:unnamed protein product [Effrenium voratum]